MRSRLSAHVTLECLRAAAKRCEEPPAHLTGRDEELRRDPADLTGSPGLQAPDSLADDPARLGCEVPTWR
jgi:hypothetical protein